MVLLFLGTFVSFGHFFHCFKSFLRAASNFLEKLDVMHKQNPHISGIIDLTVRDNDHLPIIFWWAFPLYMLDKSICYFKGVTLIIWFLFYFLTENPVANTADPDQTPHYVASDLGLHCLPLTLLRVSR